MIILLTFELSTLASSWAPINSFNSFIKSILSAANCEVYNDSISSGNVGFISNYNDNQSSYSVNIGNLKPKQQIKLNTTKCLPKNIH